MPVWFEEFFEGLYGRVLADQFRREDSLRQARLVKRLLRARKGTRVLDVPCGQGRLTVPLARMGLEMTGLDLTGKYLRRARRAARREGLEVRFLRGDMREIDFEEEFSAVFNWFGSFGYFSDADNLRFCRRVLRALKPGGRFLVEGTNKPFILANFKTDMTSTVGGVRLRQRPSFDAARSRIRCTWHLRRGERTERHRISMRIFSGAEIRALLREAGFSEVKLYGSPPVRGLKRGSRRLIAVARKSKRRTRTD